MKHVNLLLLVVILTSIVCSCDKTEDAKQTEPTPTPQPSIEETDLKAVDLGLSISWANMNIGAKSNLEIGDYYSWGEIETKNSFSEDTYSYKKTVTYSYYVFGVESHVYEKEADVMSRYWTKPLTGEHQTLVSSSFFPDYLTTLKLDDDTVWKQVGEEINKQDSTLFWRMPTKAEYEELMAKCKFAIVEDLSSKAALIKCTGPNGKHIYFPLYRMDNTTRLGEYFWTSSLCEDEPNNAFLATIASSRTSIDMKERYFGANVRGVMEIRKEEEK